jgi:hypothetical protein
MISKAKVFKKNAPASMNVYMEGDTYFRFNHRCHFYDISPREVFVYCIKRFLRGDFDKDLDIPTEPDV